MTDPVWPPPPESQPPEPFGLKPESFGAPEMPPEHEPMVEFEEVEEKMKSKLVATIAVIFVVLALIVGGAVYLISRGDDANDKTDGTEQSEEETPENAVSAEDGGEVETEFGVRIIVPENALEKDTVLEVERVAAGDVIDVYHFRPEGLKFLKPVEIVIPYNEDAFEEGETPETIKLYFSKTRYGARSELEFTVDAEEKVLRTAVEEF